MQDFPFEYVIVLPKVFAVTPFESVVVFPNWFAVRPFE